VSPISAAEGWPASLPSSANPRKASAFRATDAPATTSGSRSCKPALKVAKGTPERRFGKTSQHAISRILFSRASPCGLNPKVATIPLARPLLARSSDRPGGSTDGPSAPIEGSLPIWSCSVRGFACHSCYHERGALLPHLFTLTPRLGASHLARGRLPEAGSP
jgi:hypothetical protein